MEPSEATFRGFILQETATPSIVVRAVSMIVYLIFILMYPVPHNVPITILIKRIQNFLSGYNSNGETIAKIMSSTPAIFTPMRAKTWSCSLIRSGHGPLQDQYLRCHPTGILSIFFLQIMVFSLLLLQNVQLTGLSIRVRTNI